MKIRILFIALLFSTLSFSQVNIAAFGTNYTQDFNTLTNGTWTNGTTLAGWYARTDATASITTYVANTGTSTAANLNAYGIAGINPLSDRALGISNSNAFTGGSGTGKAYYGWRLRNTTGSAITSLTVTWTGEQWRRISNVNPQTLSLSYQTGTTVTNLTAGVWTSAGSTFTTPQFGSAAAVALDGNDPLYRLANISVTLTLVIAAGDEIMLRWEDLNDSGNDHLMAIDDVTVVANGLYTAVANGDWNTAATWDRNAVPPASANVLIPSPWTVYLNGTASTTTRNAGTTTTVDVGGTLSTANVGVTNTNSYVNNGTTTINGTFRLEGNSTASGNNFVYGATTGTLNFSNTAAKTVVNTDVFWPAAVGFRPYNVNVLFGGITMSSPATRTVDGIFSTASRGGTNGVTTVVASVLTLNGTIRINENGQFATAASAPIYGPASTLIYNTGTVTNRSFEWNATSAGVFGTTPGYPNNIQIIYNVVTASNTGINLNSGTLSRPLNGNLTTDAGCGLTMPLATTADLIVGGSVINNGFLTLSPAGTTGGNLRLAGNFTNGASGSFTGNTRSVYFTNTSPTVQTISNANPGALIFPYVLTNGASTQVQLLNDLTISSPNASVNGGVALTLAGTSVFDLNGRTLTIGTATVANTVAGTGTIKGSTSSNLTLLGTGSVGTLNFTTGFQNLGTFTINRTAAAIGCVMGTPLTINASLVLTNGLIDLGANAMTLASACSNSFTSSANSYVIADAAVTGGVLYKEVNATGIAYNFPLGLGGYSPATVTYTLGTFSGSTLGIAVKNTIHPNWSSATTGYINRYWSLSTTVSTPQYNFSATYPAAELVGTLGTYFKSNQWNGTDWTNDGIAVASAGTISKPGCTITTAVNHISAAIRDQEIEVKSGTNGLTIPNGTTTTGAFGNAAYGTQTIGSNTPHTFSIHNRGGIGLGLTNTPRVEILDGNPIGTSGDFTVTIQPSSATVPAESSLTFQITFNPSYSGYRSATVRIINTDADEGSYTFIIDGYGQCAVASANTITPSSGPVGTEVTITATVGTLTAATAAFNGVSATVTPIDATHIIATVPTGAVSGTLITTTTQGCQASNIFTVIDNASTSCGGGLTVPELFISEVTDATYGGLTYIEIYNGTSGPKNLADYTLRFYANGNTSTYGTFTPSSGTINVGQTVVFSTPTAGFACPGTAASGAFPGALATGVAGINFADGSGVESLGHDHIALYNNVSAANVDVWGVFGNQSWATALNLGDRGATFRRKNTATLPSTTYNNADWNVSNWLGTGAGSCATNDYSDIGTFNFRAGAPPTVTTLTYTSTCKATTLTVTGGEGVVGGAGIIYNWYAVANGSNTWNLIADGGIYSGATTGTLSISDIATVLNYQFYCEVWENTNTCYKASNAIKITPSSSTTWTAGGWSNGLPTLDKAAIINANYDTALAAVFPNPVSFDACSLTINNPAIVTVQANDYINIKNDLTVNSGARLDIENNASLVMVEDNGVVTNSGTTNIKRTSTPYERFDYIYWSSPVAAANANIASTFSGWRTDYSFEFNTANFYDSRTINSSGTVTSITSDSFDDVAPWAWQNYNGNMTSGKGYAIMAPTGVTFSPSAPGVPVTFSGRVNNGIIPLALVQTANTDVGFVGVNNPNDDYNLVGNPYPSALFANKFIIDNGANTSGTLYFWTHVLNISNTNPGPNVQNFISDDYALYNMTGGTRASLTTPASAIPTGYIGSGQGFFVEAQSSNNLIFNNSMRSKTYANTQFFKTVIDGIDQKDRVWLNLVNADGMFGQQLIGYFDETTLGFDWAYDGRVNLSNNYVSFYSLAGDEKYKIQARPAFDAADIVPLGYFSAVTGEFTIGIDKMEGVFELESTPIYLEDKEMNIIHNLKESSYTFTTNFGRFEDRFVLRYTDAALGNPDFETLDSSVSIATNHGEMIIKSHIENIQDVTVYDILGRQLFESKNIANNNFTAANISNSQQTLIVKIKLANGFMVTRKIIL